MSAWEHLALPGSQGLRLSDCEPTHTVGVYLVLSWHQDFYTYTGTGLNKQTKPKQSGNVLHNNHIPNLIITLIEQLSLHHRTSNMMERQNKQIYQLNSLIFCPHDLSFVISLIYIENAITACIKP